MPELATPVPDRCELLGPFALFIQGIMGLLAISSLVWKRSNEYPHRRPWKIWFFDVSKQVLGAIGIHCVNVFLSILGGNSDKFMAAADAGAGKQDNDGDTCEDCDNPCNYYFLNILFDTTIGIPILWAALYCIFGLARKASIEGIESGQYGTPPKYSYYFKQLGLYFLGLLSMKVIVALVLFLCPFLISFASWVLSWSDGIPTVQVFFVVLIFPLIMNTIQYYVIDNIIQSPEYHAMNKLISKMDEQATESGNVEEEQRLVHGMLGQHEPEPNQMEGEVVTPPKVNPL